jgi:hypothetical protein
MSTWLRLAYRTGLPIEGELATGQGDFSGFLPRGRPVNHPLDVPAAAALLDEPQKPASGSHKPSSGRKMR